MSSTYNKPQIVVPGTSAGLVSASGLTGSTSGGAISAGFVGEKISANSAGVSVGSTGNYVTICSISLTAGIWLVTGTAAFDFGTIIACTAVLMGISSTNNALDSVNNGNLSEFPFTTVPTSLSLYASVGPRYVNISSTTTYYLVGRANYTTAGSATWDANSYIQGIRIA